MWFCRDFFNYHIVKKASIILFDFLHTVKCSLDIVGLAAAAWLG